MPCSLTWSCRSAAAGLTRCLPLPPARLSPAELAPQLERACPDALAVLRQLSADGMLAVGATRRAVELPAEAAGGPDRIMPVPGLFHGGWVGGWVGELMGGCGVWVGG